VFDKDSNGTVSLAEIKAVLSEVYDENFDDLQDLVGMKTVNGRLDFNMFVKLMTGAQF
jgi:Ca2+-binding EF-hand superfamily protein